MDYVGSLLLIALKTDQTSERYKIMQKPLF